MSDTHPCYYNADYFMGSILPDAVCSRTVNTVQHKNRSHILTDRTTWKKDVLESYGRIDEPSMLIKGYFAHILTDIEFRTFMRQYYDKYQVPLEMRDKYDKILMPLAMRELFPSIKEYLICIDFAEGFSNKDFPFQITMSEVLANLQYARNIFETEIPLSSNQDIDIPIPDIKKWCGEFTHQLFSLI